MACEGAEPSNSEGEIQSQTNALMLSLKRPPVTQLVLGLVVGLGLGLGLRPSTNEPSVDRARRVQVRLIIVGTGGQLLGPPGHETPKGQGGVPRWNGRRSEYRT